MRVVCEVFFYNHVTVVDQIFEHDLLVLFSVFVCNC